MKNSKFFALFMVFTVLLFAISCSKDNATGGTTLRFKSAAPLSKSVAVDAVTIESFKINVSEIEFEVDDNDDIEENDTFATDLEFKGPFEVDLIKNSNLWETTVAEQVNIPEGYYDEIEFKFDKNENPISVMAGKSVYVKGTINGKPFVYFTDEEFEVEIEFNNSVLLEDFKQNLLTVSINIGSLFDPAKGGISIAGATDGNANGTIEIYPGDPDGNSTLAHQISDLLDDITDAFEEDDDN